uniref:ShKT domain-containing protein n=1 Tax=Ditylenchus dipsaci TaxID=166011 RepID=A0A915CTF7_9BILA
MLLIMHYDSMAFSKNGRETLIAKSPQMTHVIGSALDFSPTDLSKIQRMYQCSGFAEPIDTSGLEFSNSISSRMASAPVIRPYNSLILPRRPPSGTQPLHAPIPSVTNSFIPRALPVQTTTQATTQPCVDRATLCWRWLDRCNSVFFEKIMREFCALSCENCTPHDKEPMIKSKTVEKTRESLGDVPSQPISQEMNQMRSYPVLINAPAS